MPSTYAHYRMGQNVRKLLNDKDRKIVETYPELFLIGLHGPDILFYYKPLFNNRINRIGYEMHGRPGKEFFEYAAGIIRNNNMNYAYIAYVYGFICHFVLDETCHGYIEDKIAASGISHTEIEVEFDRMLMIKDGYDPLRHNLTNHIVPSMKNARVIQAFFQGADSEHVCKALKSMISNNKLLIAPNKGKRLFINTLLAVTGNYKEMHGLMVNYERNRRCDDSTKKLWNLYQEAERLAISLITEYDKYLKGKTDLNQIYNYTFGSQLAEQGEIKHAV